MVAIEWGYLAKHGDNPPTLAGKTRERIIIS